jgi:hypothetical protein
LLKAALSRLHSKLEPASVEEKLKLAEELFTVPDGPESIVVSGGVVSAGAAVVKDQVLSVTSALPEVSLAPLLPPLTVAV